MHPLSEAAPRDGGVFAPSGEVKLDTERARARAAAPALDGGDEGDAHALGVLGVSLTQLVRFVGDDDGVANPLAPMSSRDCQKASAARLAARTWRSSSSSACSVLDAAPTGSAVLSTACAVV